MAKLVNSEKSNEINDKSRVVHHMVMREVNARIRNKDKTGLCMYCGFRHEEDWCERIEGVEFYENGNIKNIILTKARQIHRTYI